MSANAWPSDRADPAARANPPLSLWRLRVLTAVIETGSATAAAGALGLTQPAVTQALQRLSADYGAPLITRRDGALRPTPAGLLLNARGQAALALMRDGLREAVGRAAAETPSVLRALSARRLESLRALARHGDFSGAARALGRTPPTLHRTARDLEAALGVALFERTSHGVQPTRKAALLARRAGLAAAELAQAQAEIAAAQGRTAGRTVIGALPLARSHLAPAAVAAFSAGYPGHRVCILEGAYDDLIAGLRRGEVDLVLGALRAGVAADVVQEPLFEDALALIMRAGHPAAGAARLDGDVLSAYPWIAPRPDSPLRGQFHALFQELAAPPPSDVVECNSLAAARVILARSDRLMLLSAAQIRHEAAAGMLVARPHPLGPITRRIGLTRRAGWRPTAVQEALLAAIRAEADAAASCGADPVCHTQS